MAASIYYLTNHPAKGERNAKRTCSNLNRQSTKRRAGNKMINKPKANTIAIITYKLYDTTQNQLLLPDIH